jgi:hypothetical protein
VQHVQGDLPCCSTKESWASLKAWSWKSSKNGFGATLPIVKQTHAINLCYMNAQKERGRDFENFGTRITGFGVVVEKI